MRFIISGLFLFALSIRAIASPYIGFGVGSVQYEADLTSLGGGTLDDNSTGTKLYGGYGFTRYLSVEIAAYKFAESSIGSLVINSTTTVSAAAKSTGYAAYAVASYPFLKKVSLAAKAGVLRWDADLRVNSTTATNDGTDLAFGLMASYAFTKELAIAGEWEQFNSDNPELSLITVGFRYSFK